MGPRANPAFRTHRFQASPKAPRSDFERLCMPRSGGQDVRLPSSSTPRARRASRSGAPPLRSAPLHLESRRSARSSRWLRMSRALGGCRCDLGAERVGATPDADVALPRGTAKDWVGGLWLDGGIRGPGSFRKIGGLADVLRLPLPPGVYGRRVLACGFGIRCSAPGFRAPEVERRRCDASQQSTCEVATDELLGAIARAAAELLSSDELWAPIERCGVGRTRFWEMSLERWWCDLVPRLWASYRRRAPF